MTPEGEGPQLRPLALGEILDVSIKIFFSHWRTLLTAALVVVVPVQIVITILTADYTVSSFEFDASQTPEETLEELNDYLGGLAISAILQASAVLLATAACFRAVAQAYLGEQTDWRASLAYALRRAPQLLLITLLYVLGWGIAAIFFIAPGVWLYVAWAFAIPVLLVEGSRGPKALGRSFKLVSGRWWRTFGVLLLGFVLALVVSTVVQGVFFLGMFAGSDNDLFVLVLSAIAGTVGLAITTPFQAALLAVVYFDLRVRKEGFDLELLAERIGGSVPAGGGGLAPTGPAPAGVSAPTPAAGGGAPGAADGPAMHWPAPPPAGPAAGQPPPAPEQGPPPPPPGWPPPAPSTVARPAAPAPEPAERRDEPPDEPPRLPGVPHG